MKPFEIFKAGTQTASNGAKIDFSASDLEASAKAYDPALHEAPIVVGHPREDAPAYGWVSGLSFAESALLASPDQVDASFAELVKEGRFKKVSASFYLPDAPQNPAPGVYYLRHVGFLGAMPPAVKGLKPITFAGSEEGIVEFGDWTDSVIARLFRSIREWIIEKSGTDEADKVIPSWNIEDLEASAHTPEVSELPAYSEPTRGRGAASTEDAMRPEEIVAQAEALKAREQKLDEREASFAEREAAIKTQEKAAQHAGHVTFVESLVQAGQMLPAHRDHAVALLDFAAGLENGVIEFGEKKESAEQFLKAFLAAWPKVIEYAEVATRESDPGKGGAGEKIAALIQKKRAEDKSLSYSEAFELVQIENPELTAEYIASM